MEVGSSFFWLHCRLFIFVEVLVEFDKLCIRQPNPNNYCDSEASCFVQERPNMAQNWHFCSFWARPCWLIWCPFGGLVGGCGARAVSRKTPIYFIYLSCYMDLSKLMFTDFSKWLYGFFKVLNGFFCFRDLSKFFLCMSRPFAEQNQAEVWPRFACLLKVLFWTKGVEWVKVLNTLSPLCLWQCL